MVWIQIYIGPWQKEATVAQHFEIVEFCEITIVTSAAATPAIHNAIFFIAIAGAVRIKVL